MARAALCLAALALATTLSGAHAAANATSNSSSPCEVKAAPTVAEDADQNVGFAFAMAIGAGMCTTIGGALAHFGEIEDKRFLTASLAVSGGVMVYVSFIEIFGKSKGAFIEEFMASGSDEAQANAKASLVTTLLFFAGMLLTWLMDYSVHKFVESRVAAKQVEGVSLEVLDGSKKGANDILAAPEEFDVLKSCAKTPGVPQVCPCDAHGADGGRKVVSVKDAHELLQQYDTDNEGALNMDALRRLVTDLNRSIQSVADGKDVADGNSMAGQSEADLQAMGLFTALSIFVHNFPEGLATFVATLADPHAGAALAFAVGLHNIPEGICVGVPIYYATGSRSKAFLWSFLSGVSEPIGGLIGYLLLVVASGGQDISPVAYGTMFGIVAGMMAFIVFAELLPSAHKYDPKDEIATPFFVLGMAIMAASLLAFLIPDF